MLLMVVVAITVIIIATAVNAYGIFMNAFRHGLFFLDYTHFSDE